MKKDKSPKQQTGKWFIRRLYNILLIAGMILVCCVGGKHVLTRVTHVDSYLSSISPYTTLADMLNIHAESGLRLKIPKPVLLQVVRDLVPVLARARNIFGDLYLDCKETVMGEDVERKEKRMQEFQRSMPVVTKPAGASLLYVSSFCKELFGDLTPLETCRADLKMNCAVDVLAWFDISPSESAETMETVQNCLTNKYRQQPDFVTKFNTRIQGQESHARRAPVLAPRRGQKLLPFVLLAVVLVAAVGVKSYRIVLQTIKDKEMEDRRLAIDGQAVMLQPDNLKDEPDMSTACQQFHTDNRAEGEEESWGHLDWVLVETRPVSQIDAALEDVEELSDHTKALSDAEDSQFAVCDLIIDIDPELYLWAIIVEQLDVSCDDFTLHDDSSSGDGNISATCTLHTEEDSLLAAIQVMEVHLSDENEGEFESEDPPPMLKLDMSWQENMLENARVGITTIHQCDFDFDIEDGEGATEDNIVVTGFTVDKDDPLKFVFWKKRLRDVRELLKADALAKLKETCPTLFAMGWFKENVPKQGTELEKEDEEMKNENNIMSEKAIEGALKKEKDLLDFNKICGQKVTREQ